MTLRIDVKDLGEEVCASLERGEAVEIERDGRVVAKIEPPKGGLLAVWERWQEMEPLDEEFARDLEMIRKWGNRPVELDEWDS